MKPRYLPTKDDGEYTESRNEHENTLGVAEGGKTTLLTFGGSVEHTPVPLGLSRTAKKRMWRKGGVLHTQSRSSAHSDGQHSSTQLFFFLHSSNLSHTTERPIASIAPRSLLLVGLQQARTDTQPVFCAVSTTSQKLELTVIQDYSSEVLSRNSQTEQGFREKKDYRHHPPSLSPPKACVFQTRRHNPPPP